MTTESPVEADIDNDQTAEPLPYETPECHNCRGAVAKRRPSKTGAHFCSRPDCIKAKSRFYYRRNLGEQLREEAELEHRRVQVRETLILEFVRSALHDDRIDCTTCGRPGVVPAYTHPTPDWAGACDAVRFKELPTSDPINFGLMQAAYPAGT